MAIREIVGAIIRTIITNNRNEISAAYKRGDVTCWLDRDWMKFMADCDLGRNWELMANGPTLFCLDENGFPLPKNTIKEGSSL